MKISEPLWRDSIPTVQYRDIVLHCVVHIYDFRRNSNHFGSYRGSSSSCAGAHVDEIFNYLKTKCHQSWVISSPHFSFWSTLGPSWTTRTERQDGLVWCRCPISLLVTIWLQLHLNCNFLKNWRIRLALQATFYGHSEVVTTLLEAGADPTVR